MRAKTLVGPAETRTRIHDEDGSGAHIAATCRLIVQKEKERGWTQFVLATMALHLLLLLSSISHVRKSTN